MINPDRMECDTRIFSIKQRYPGYESLAQVLPLRLANLFLLEQPNERIITADTKIIGEGKSCATKNITDDQKRQKQSELRWINSSLLRRL
jgi:hypothetical protein